jgi:hypothetical protein
MPPAGANSLELLSALQQLTGRYSEPKVRAALDALRLLA